MTWTACTAWLGLRPSSCSWRLTGSIPRRQTRASSAPKTASTAPPANAPSTRVRPDEARPTCVASLSRFSLRAAMSAALAQVGLGELGHEDPSELDQRPELRAEVRAAGAEGGQLLGEVADADAQHAGGHELGLGVLAELHVAAQDVGEERRRVLPDVEARVVAHELEARERQRVAHAVAEPQPVEHALDAGLGVDEEVEDAALDRQLAAQRVAAQVADRARLTQRIGAEALDVRDLDGQVEHQCARAVAGGLGPPVEVGLAERDVSQHLLGEADGCGHAAAASAARWSGSSMLSAKRSARAAIVKLGLGPTGPGMTEPSAICRPG